ncbi:hypothetical protein Hipma_0109 [Hippea maritima DSM 10411]|uniref:Uncharacterized protein n=2 Tax=Hippea TaxID=84404 RepID=F2LX31_HIPMA|nr:hypothetical protein Hipma_0109 [Hippea maritima DSM 10411]
MGNKTYVKAIKDDGNVDLIIYGRHNEVDTLTYMEVEGKIKNQFKNYLIVDSINIIDRFNSIRGSFLRLSLAMLILEVTYRSNSGLSLLLEGLNRLKITDNEKASIFFFYIFLKKNGIFDEKKFNFEERNLLLQIEKNNQIRATAAFLRVLKNKLLKEVQAYIGKPLNSLKLLMR